MCVVRERGSCLPLSCSHSHLLRFTRWGMAQAQEAPRLTTALRAYAHRRPAAEEGRRWDEAVLAAKLQRASEAEGAAAAAGSRTRLWQQRMQAVAALPSKAKVRPTCVCVCVCGVR